MISLCKCCFLLEKHEHNSQSHSGSIGSCSGEAEATNINKIKQDTTASTKAKITRPSDLVLKPTQDKANDDEEGDKVALLVTDQDSAILENNAGLEIVQEQPSSKSLLRKLSEDHSHFEEDSGTCVDHSNSSEITLDNLVDKVQLTVSSVNSILPDLPEQDDDCEEKPLLPILPTGPIGLQLPTPNSNTNQKPSCIPMVVLAASKRQHRSLVVQKNNDHVTNTTNHNGTGNGNTGNGGSSVGSSHHSSTESVKPSVLKKPKPPYSRQCSAPSTACSSLTPPVSEGSSRRDSGAEFDKFSSSATSASSTVQVRKNREKSPCVSFDTDIRYHVPEVSEIPGGTSASAGGGAMRARSRSDASSRFKGKIAWLRDRRDLLRSSTIAEDRESVTKSNNAVSITPASAHRPRTRSDTRWIKINRKKALENTRPNEAKKAFEWPMASNFSRRWRKQKKVSEDNTVASKVPKDLERSQSVAGLTNHEVEKTISSKLKRHGSERGQTAKKSVAFETGNNSWWNASMKLLFDMTGGKSNKSKTRRRHMSSDARNVLLLNTHSVPE